MFGKYYILRKSGNIEELTINSEEETIASMQNENSFNNDFVFNTEQKVNSVLLTDEKYDMCDKIKSYVNNAIMQEINPLNISSPTIFKKTLDWKSYKNYSD